MPRLKSPRPSSPTLAALSLASTLAVICVPGARAGDTAPTLAPPQAAPGSASTPTATGKGFSAGLEEVLEWLKPKSMQKRPTVYFTFNTEMTPEGRQRRTPTAVRPVYYALHPNPFTQLGLDVAAGEKPPPVDRLEAAMKNALAASHYLPMPPGSSARPELLITFTYGSHGLYPQQWVSPDTFPLPRTSGELLPFLLRDPAMVRDILEKAKLFAGEKFALGLKKAFEQEVANMRLLQAADRNPGGRNTFLFPVSPDFNSPFQMFVHDPAYPEAEYFADMIFNTCYFVIATAADYDAAMRFQKRPLWRTSMVVEANALSLEETLVPMIADAAPYFGRETSWIAMRKRQLDREGTVTIGTAEVVRPEQDQAGASEKKTPPVTPSQP